MRKWKKKKKIIHRRSNEKKKKEKELRDFKLQRLIIVIVRSNYVIVRSKRRAAWSATHSHADTTDTQCVPATSMNKFTRET